MNNKIKAGIIGGAGYTGGEMLRILLNHPNVEIAFVHSNSNAGNLISDVHTDLFGDTDLRFTGRTDYHQMFKEVNANSLENTVIFLCVGHGDAKKFLEANPIDAQIRIIDLSQDFRLKANAVLNVNTERTFVYGLPELNKEAIKSAKNIANPGCFATCIQLALLPLAYKGLLKSEVHINATTGSTGAGQSLSKTSHFSWRNNNISVYNPFGHRHLKEISESINSLQEKAFAKTPSSSKRDEVVMNFIPQRGDFTRGIFAATYTDYDFTEEEAYQLYEDFYAEHPFTHVSRKNIDLKQVVNTNKCLIHLEKHGDKLFIINMEDNLVKGASGQAVQNMNLMFGLEEKTGLMLKAVNF